MSIKPKIDAVSEAIKDYGVAVLVLTITACVIICTYYFVDTLKYTNETLKSTNSFIKTTETEVKNISVATQKMEQSIRAVPVDLRRYIIRDESFWTSMKTMVNRMSDDSHKVMNSLLDLSVSGNVAVLRLADLLQTSEKFVGNVDLMVNGKIAPEVIETLEHLNHKTLVLFEDGVVGVLNTANTTLEKVTEDVRAFIGDETVQNDVKAMISAVRIILQDGMAPISINLAKIVSDAKDVSKFYRDKLINPSLKERLWAFFKLVLFSVDAVSPYIVSNKLYKVKVVE